MTRIPTRPPLADLQFRLLVQSISDYAIYMLDPAGTVISWNVGAQRITGYGAEEIVGRNYAGFFTPEDQAAGTPAVDLVVALEAGRFEGEGWRVRKDGTRYWASVVVEPIYDLAGAFVSFAKITRDMTEKRAVLEDLRRSEQRLRLLVDSVVQYAIFTLSPEGRVTSWNAGAQRAKGYTRDEILGETYARFFTPQDQASGRPAQILATAYRAGRFEDEGWRVRKDGTRYWASIVVEPMWDQNGEFAGYAKVTRDITDKRALDEAREQLHQAQKMEAVGQLTGGIAHDFNNLLAAVLASLELVGTHNTDSRVERLVTIARRAAERGATLTHQLLAFSRRQTLAPQISDLNRLVGAFEELLRQACGGGVELRVELDEALWLSSVDPAQFQSALLNLVINARDAMPGGGTLAVRTRNVTLDAAAAARLTGLAPGEYVVVTVQDSGAGMSPQVKARAVEPFYTTKDVGQGSGLGLSQVYGFVLQSEGQMEIASESGEGTAVSLYLPRHAGVAAADDLPRLQPAQRSAGTVLVVEDDPDVLQVAVEAVRSFGYAVHLARNASEAMAFLKRNPAVDLLFSDVVMPAGMSGLDLARKARRLHPSIRVLLASGYPRTALQENEDMAFIAKPYSLSSLSKKLGELSRPPASGTGLR
jgi:PAS domain S-box-containing protein